MGGALAKHTYQGVQRLNSPSTGLMVGPLRGLQPLPVSPAAEAPPPPRPCFAAPPMCTPAPGPGSSCSDLTQPCPGLALGRTQQLCPALQAPRGKEEEQAKCQESHLLSQGPGHPHSLWPCPQGPPLVLCPSAKRLQDPGQPTQTGHQSSVAICGPCWTSRSAPMCTEK